jgi:hemolysin activation/secretion protein
MKINNSILFFAVLSLGMMVRPVFVFGDVSPEVQKEAIQLQADMVQMINERRDLQQQEMPQAEVDMQQQEPVPQAQGPSFQVNEIILVGNTLFSTQQLHQYVIRYEDRVLTLKDLQDLARLITGRYQMAGYMTSRAFVPPQRIFDGKVVIRIVEGRVGRIAISGNRWFSDHLYFDRLNLEPGQFFDVQQLVMSLQDMNQLPDRFVKAYLQSGQESGTSDVVITAQDQNPIHASYEYNNQGTALTHWTRGIFHFTDNNLTGNGDSLQASISGTEQNSFLGGMIQYVLPQPKEGLTYSLNGGYDYNRLEKYLRSLKVTSRSFDVSPGVTKSFIKAPGLKVDGFMGFEFKDAKVLIDKNKLSFDRSRVLDVGPRVAIDDNEGKTFVAGDLRLGIPDILNGSRLHDPEASRIDSGGEFVYLTSSVDRINRLPYGSYLILHAGGQYSPMPLTSLEQDYLGGMYSVRGYPDNDSSGDSGFNFSAELRIPPYFIPPDWHVWNSKDKTWRDTFSFVTFVDGGRVFNLKRQDAGSPKDRTLLGTGLGVRYYLSPDMNCQAGVGFPFGEKSTDGKNIEPYVSARVGF